MRVSHSVKEYEVSVNHKSALNHRTKKQKLCYTKPKQNIKQDWDGSTNRPILQNRKTLNMIINSEAATMESLPKGIKDRLMS